MNVLATLLTKAIIRIIYIFFCLFFPVKKDKVSFASYRTNTLQGNLLYLFKEIETQYPNYHFKILFKKLDSTTTGKISYLFHMFKSTYHLATSKYFFIDDYYFPIYLIKPRKSTAIIQLWHAAGAFKKFGYSTVGKSYGPSEKYLKHVKIHSNYSKVMVSSTEVIPHFAEAFNMSPNNILPLGLPRTDFLLQENKREEVKNRLYSKYPTLKGKKIILYAPTFRGKGHNPGKFQGYLDFGELKSVLGNQYAIVVKLHPYMRKQLTLENTDKEFVFQLKGFNTEEFLIIADLLITDYSSIIFDYSLLGRPMAFYANDLEEYKKERDFYYEYESLVPGPIFKNTTDLAKWIVEAKYDLNEVKKFSNRFFNELDGNACKRIVDAVFQAEVDHSVSYKLVEKHEMH